MLLIAPGRRFEPFYLLKRRSKSPLDGLKLKVKYISTETLILVVLTLKDHLNKEFELPSDYAFETNNIQVTR